MAEAIEAFYLVTTAKTVAVGMDAEVYWTVSSKQKLSYLWHSYVYVQQDLSYLE